MPAKTRTSCAYSAWGFLGPHLHRYQRKIPGEAAPGLSEHVDSLGVHRSATGMEDAAASVLPELKALGSV